MIINSKDIFLDVKKYTIYINQEAFINNVLRTYVSLEVTTYDNREYSTYISQYDKYNIGHEKHLEIVKNIAFSNILDQISDQEESIYDVKDHNNANEITDDKCDTNKVIKHRKNHSKKTSFAA